ncbi:MAG TPA: DUF1330 domain-containing protein [Thermoleophilia bacterium]|nr:DUF1330 domain-containing protein [Thermoleophilia bacterium]
MAAYVVARLCISNEQAFARYREIVSSTIESHGGRYLARGNRFEVVEGSDRPERIVILEFPDFETALRWHESEEYAPAKALRESCTETEMLIVEGLA